VARPQPRERFRHPRQRFHRRDHVFLIAAVVADAANQRVRAVHEVPATAGKTSAVLPAVPADSNALAFPPFLHARAEFVDHAGHFVSWDARIGNAGEKAFLRNHVAVTDSTSLDADSYVSRSWLRNFSFHDFEIRPCLWHLHGFHFRHWMSPFASVYWSRIFLRFLAAVIWTSIVTEPIKICRSRFSTVPLAE